MERFSFGSPEQSASKNVELSGEIGEKHMRAEKVDAIATQLEKFRAKSSEELKNLSSTDGEVRKSAREYLEGRADALIGFSKFFLREGILNPDEDEINQSVTAELGIILEALQEGEN